MKRLLVLALTACMLGGTLAGCGSSGETGSASSEAAASSESSDEKEVSMDMIWWTDGNETVAMQKLIDEYHELHPNITINIQEIAYDDLNTKLQMAIAGGEAPALSRGTETTISKLHDSMVNLADYTDADTLSEQFLDSVNYLYKSDGQLVALPTEVTANGLVYNKTAFEAAGVAVPDSADDIWTWDEFKEALQKVVDSGAVKYGMAVDNAAHRWSTILYEFGGSLANENGGNLSSQESLNAINFT